MVDPWYDKMPDNFASRRKTNEAENVKKSETKN